MKVVVWIRLREGSSGGKVLIVFNDSMIRGGCAGSGGRCRGRGPPQLFPNIKVCPFPQIPFLEKCLFPCFYHNTSSQYMFWPEGSPEEQKRFLRDFRLAEDLPVRFYLDSLGGKNDPTGRIPVKYCMIPLEISSHQNTTGSPGKPAEALQL